MTLPRIVEFRLESHSTDPRTRPYRMHLGRSAFFRRGVIPCIYNENCEIFAGA